MYRIFADQIHAVFVKSIILLAAVLCAGIATAADKPLVFVSVTPQKYLLEKVAGDTIQIEVLVQPGHNPHSYDPTARQMARLAKAKLLMTTGVPFEQVWLPRIRRLNPEMAIIDTLEGIVEQKPAYPEHKDDQHDETAHDDHDEHSHEAHEHEEKHGHKDHDHEGHDHDSDDPHVWMDPIKATAQARIMANALKAAQPQHAAIYEQNYQQLASEFKALDHEIHEALENYEGRTFMVFHPAWGHFAARYHIEQVAIEYQGKSPSARQLVSLSEKAKAEQIKVILVQEQFNQKPAERIADNIGARVVKADPLPENLPLAIRQLSQQLLESWQ
ncbi:metal ABC transporter solute-binding protein, Zn/Mn family [Oceanospirillum sanctuarii]|uniref:metal ABC transporter solute-binding protein, Zn/Mn family n=1 Tax=Oceanospirillum sanctuarii TaxID=1434821 RepID=UPI000A36C7FF|nr:zinc ABC transporter substrate-binding protein [Oceanospirillum sanctuarii]